MERDVLQRNLDSVSPKSGEKLIENFYLFTSADRHVFIEL